MTRCEATPSLLQLLTSASFFLASLGDSTYRTEYALSLARYGLADSHFENPARAFTLLNECIDHRLAKEVEGHEVLTVLQAGWAGIQNGRDAQARSRTVRCVCDS
jgi:hypothetical protein